MKKNASYLIFIEFIVVMLFINAFFYFASYQNRQIKSFDISDVEYNEALYVGVKSQSIDDKEQLVIQGYAYDLRNIEQFNNYVTGSGQNLFVNVEVLLLDSNQQAFKLNTSSRYDDTLGSFRTINLRYFGFTAKIELSKLDPNKNYQIAVLSKDIRGNQSYKVISEVVYD